MTDHKPMPVAGYTTQSQTNIDLANRFADPDLAGTIVKFRSVFGDVNVQLFDAQKPITVDNFLRYVDGNLYDNSMIHRSVPGFVVQGGGFRATVPSPPSISSFPPILNEPGIPNTRGTIAMAKLGGNPNSATNQWFFNLADNRSILDGQNGGFTVFGRVIGDGGEPRSPDRTGAEPPHDRARRVRRRRGARHRC